MDTSDKPKISDFCHELFQSDMLAVLKVVKRIRFLLSDGKFLERSHDSSNDTKYVSEWRSRLHHANRTRKSHAQVCGISSFR